MDTIMVMNDNGRRETRKPLDSIVNEEMSRSLGRWNQSRQATFVQPTPDSTFVNSFDFLEYFNLTVVAFDDKLVSHLICRIFLNTHKGARRFIYYYAHNINVSMGN